MWKQVQLYLKNRNRRWLLTLALLLAACRPLAVPAPVTPATDTPSLLPGVTSTSAPSPTWTPSLTPSFTPLPSLTPTPDAYGAYTIAHLQARSYGGGELSAQGPLDIEPSFTRMLITYPSDGLTIYGFMNVPQGEGPFPVVIALHGYIDPAVYGTLDYTTRYADSLAQAGFLVLHPNLRGYPPSDSGENLLRVGMAIDVLNLIALVQAQGGQPGPLEQADPQTIGLWGHSMGGGITTRVLVVSPDVDAAVLYAAMSGDERRNFEAINGWSEGQRGLEELAVPVDELNRISPIYFLDQVQAPVSIHHGEADTLVPLDWSLEMCETLTDLEKPVECFTYPGQPHTFYGDGDRLFQERVVQFFERTLRSGAG